MLVHNPRACLPCRRIQWRIDVGTPVVEGNWQLNLRPSFEAFEGWLNTEPPAPAVWAAAPGWTVTHPKKGSIDRPPKILPRLTTKPQR